MSHVVRRSLIGVALVSGLALTGCSGPGSGSAEAQQTTVQTSEPSLPPPAGAGCAAVADAGALAELNLVEAVKEIPTAQTFGTYLSADPAREKAYGDLDGVTVFVPVDSAWTKLDAAQTQQLADPAWHRAVVEYALAPSVLVPEAFSGGETATIQTFRAPEAVLSGQAVGETIVLNGHANVMCSALQFDGGLIYLVDTVLLPSA